MSTSNPLALILETNHLTGTNFKDWLKNLKIVLTSEKIECTRSGCLNLTNPSYSRAKSYSGQVGK